MHCSEGLYSQEHLKVKGIPIDGPIDSFISQLKAKGLVDHPLAKEVGSPLLLGSFAGIDDCVFSIITLKDNISVCAVIINTPDLDKWSELKKRYFALKGQYESKYKSVNTLKEEFESPYSDGSGMELHALVEEKCNYVTGVNPPEGSIIISINPTDRRNAYVKLVYYDDINFQKYLAEREEEISEDI